MAQQTSLKLCTDHQARVVIVLTCGFPEGAGPQLKCWRSQMCSVAGDSCYLPLWRGKKKKKGTSTFFSGRQIKMAHFHDCHK